MLSELSFFIHLGVSIAIVDFLNPTDLEGGGFVQQGVRNAIDRAVSVCKEL